MRIGTSNGVLVSFFYLHNYINKLSADECQIESFVVNFMNGSLPPENIIDLVNQLFEEAKSESIPPAGVPFYIQQEIQEKQGLEMEIQKEGAILRSKNADVQTLEEYKRLEEELGKHGYLDPSGYSRVC